MKYGFVLIACLLAAALGQAEDRLITLEGLTYVKTILSIDDTARAHFANDSTPVPLDTLRRIERTVDPQSPPQHPLLLLDTNGGILLASQLSIDQHLAKFNRHDGPDIAWPLAGLRAIVLADVPHDAQNRPQFDPLLTQTLNDTATRQDHLLVIRDGQLVVVPGALVSLDATQATFIWNDQPRTINRNQLYAITFSPSDSTPPAAPHKLQLADGSLLLGKIDQLADNLLTLRLDAERSLQLPWNQITRIDIRSNRLTFISDLEPLESSTQALVTYPWPPQRDHSVMGGPLQLAGITYDKGLGVHSRTTLRYAIEALYHQFAATIGLDDDTTAAGDTSGGGGGGDCVFIVIADGKQLLNQRMTSADDPRKITADIRGVKILELIVEPGENLDIADHADWADARLIRSND